MKDKIGDAILSYLLKGGILLETKGEFNTNIQIPVDSEETRLITLEIKCNDLVVRTIKEG